jgi:hypothetical protein
MFPAPDEVVKVQRERGQGRSQFQHRIKDPPEGIFDRKHIKQIKIIIQNQLSVTQRRRKRQKSDEQNSCYPEYITVGDFTAYKTPIFPELKGGTFLPGSGMIMI